jgi:hypothetical protein
MANEKRCSRMYTPENHDQMFDIISALRTYAGTNTMPGLAEMLDDALLILASEGREELSCPAPTTARHER